MVAVADAGGDAAAGDVRDDAEAVERTTALGSAAPMRGDAESRGIGRSGCGPAPLIGAGQTEPSNSSRWWAPRKPHLRAHDHVLDRIPFR
jgi:hypothetical protein